MCFYYLKTARCIYHFEFLSCLSFLPENSNTFIITALAQNCISLDSDLSFGVTFCLRQCHSLVETGKMPSKCLISLHTLLKIFKGTLRILSLITIQSHSKSDSNKS